MISNHEIDYKIYGEELQFVEIELDPNETAIAESGPDASAQFVGRSVVGAVVPAPRARSL